MQESEPSRNPQSPCIACDEPLMVDKETLSKLQIPLVSGNQVLLDLLLSSGNVEESINSGVPLMHPQCFHRRRVASKFMRSNSARYHERPLKMRVPVKPQMATFEDFDEESSTPIKTTEELSFDPMLQAATDVSNTSRAITAQWVSKASTPHDDNSTPTDSPVVPLPPAPLETLSAVSGAPATFTRRRTFEDTEYPLSRRSIINYLVPLLRNNLMAVRDRMNHHCICPRNSTTHFSPGSTCHQLHHSCKSDTHKNLLCATATVDIHDIWREILQWLHYNDDIINDCLLTRGQLAEDTLQSILHFKFQSLPSQEESSASLLFPHLGENQLAMSERYMKNIILCMRQVDQVLQMMERLQFLCLSYKHLCSLFSQFSTEAVEQRLNTLYMWRRNMHQLNTCVYRLFQRLGAYRQDFASLLLDFRGGVGGSGTIDEATLDLCAGDVGRFEDDILISRWPEDVRSLVAGNENKSNVATIVSLPERDLRHPDPRNKLYRKYVERNMYRVGLVPLRLELRKILDLAVPFAKECLTVKESVVQVLDGMAYSSQQYNMDYDTAGLIFTMDEIQDSVNQLLASTHSGAILEKMTPQWSMPSTTHPTSKHSAGCDSLSKSCDTDTSVIVSVWSEAFVEMQLPSFLPHFLFLVRCQLDIMHQCMRVRYSYKCKCKTLTSNRPPLPTISSMKSTCTTTTDGHSTASTTTSGTETLPPPSTPPKRCDSSEQSDCGIVHDVADPVDYSSLVQLFRECKETLYGAVVAKQYYMHMVHEVLPSVNKPRTPLSFSSEKTLVDAQIGGMKTEEDTPTMSNSSCIIAVASNIFTDVSLVVLENWRRPPERYEKKLRSLMQDYFGYLWHILNRLPLCHDSSGFENFLENEWSFMKAVTAGIPGGEVEASIRFCNLISFFVQSIETFLSEAWNELERSVDERIRAIDTEEDDLSFSLNSRAGSTQDLSATEQEDSGSENSDNEDDLSDKLWRRRVSSVSISSLTHSVRVCKMRRMMMVAFRKIDAIFKETKKRLFKACDNIRLLYKDLQIAASLSIIVPQTSTDSTGSGCMVFREQQLRLFQALQNSNHVMVLYDAEVEPEHAQVHLTQHHHCLVEGNNKIRLFVPKNVSREPRRILQLLSRIFGETPPATVEKPNFLEEYEYLLFVECVTEDDGNVNWSGETVHLSRGEEEMAKLSHAEVCGIMLIAPNSRQLEVCCNYLLGLCPSGLLEMSDPLRACNQSIAQALYDLNATALNLGAAIPVTMERIQSYMSKVYSNMEAKPDDASESDNSQTQHSITEETSRGNLRRSSLETGGATSTSCVMMTPKNSSPPNVANVSSSFSAPLISQQMSASLQATPHSSTAHTENLLRVRIKFRECMQRCYRTAFFYHRELLRITTKLEVRRQHVSPLSVRLLESWMNFMKQWYETENNGEGSLSPTWTHEGCAFLLTVLQSNLASGMLPADWERLCVVIQWFVPQTLARSLSGMKNKTVSTSNNTEVSQVSQHLDVANVERTALTGHTDMEVQKSSATGMDSGHVSLTSDLSSTPLSSLSSPAPFGRLWQQTSDTTAESTTGNTDNDMRRAYSDSINSQVNETSRNEEHPKLTRENVVVASQCSHPARSRFVSIQEKSEDEVQQSVTSPSQGDTTTVAFTTPRKRVSPTGDVVDSSGLEASSGTTGNAPVVPSSQHEVEESAAELRVDMLERLEELDRVRQERLYARHAIGRVLQPLSPQPVATPGVTDEKQLLDEAKASAVGTRRVLSNYLASPEEVMEENEHGEVFRRHSNVVVRTDGTQYESFQPFERHVSFQWHMGRRLGKGTFGEVYEAVRLDTHESIVVKCIKRTTFALPVSVTSGKSSGDERMEISEEEMLNVRETLREFDLFVSLNHPNLVRYHGIEMTRTELLIFMERCPGRTLATMVNQELGELVIRKYANKLLQAVAYLHDKNIVHRDIKPENIMLCEPNDPTLLKLADFGSAARIQQNFGSVRIRRKDQKEVGLLDGLNGTSNYMAPEVCKGEPHGAKCDIWSFGCVIWELFEGKRPHRDKNPSQIIWKVAHLSDSSEALPRPKRASDESWKFIRSCLCVNPEQRASVTDLQRSEFVKVVVAPVLTSVPALWYKPTRSHHPHHITHTNNKPALEP